MKLDPRQLRRYEALKSDRGILLDILDLSKKLSQKAEGEIYNLAIEWLTETASKIDLYERAKGASK